MSSKEGASGPTCQSDKEVSLFSEALRILPDVRVAGPSGAMVVHTKPFLSVCKQVLPVVDVFGAALALVRSDIGGNISRLEGAYDKDQGRFEDLYEFVRVEKEQGTATHTYSNTNALVWLTRAMDFLLGLLRALEEDSQCSVKDAASRAYSTSLSSFHGWIARHAFTAAMLLCPSRATFFSNLGPGYASLDLMEVVAQFEPVLKQNHEFLESMGYDKLSAA